MAMGSLNKFPTIRSKRKKRNHANFRLRGFMTNLLMLSCIL